ncbi:O-antigen translocase [Chitinophagaceae bacterium LWZ2-11]
MSLIVAFSKVISALMLNKVLALFVGPQGYALIGQLQNIITSATSIASAGVNTGIVKYTAEYGNDEKKQIKLWQTAGSIGLIGTFLVSISLILCSKKISIFFFFSPDFAYLITLTACFLILYVVNTFLTSIVNGLKEVRMFAGINIANSIMSLMLTSLFAYYGGLKGALIALATGQSLVAIITILIIAKKKWLRINNFFGKIDRKIAIKLGVYGIVTLVTSLLAPFIQSIVRGIIIKNHGLEPAGYWDAMSRVSNTYLLIITFPLIAYFLPKISGATNNRDSRNFFFEGARVLLPISILCSLCLYLLRNFVIRVLFSYKFLPMEELFAWQVIGDVFRVLCWLFSYYLIAKAYIKTFIIAEISINLAILGLAYLVSKSSISHIPMIYCIANFSYFIVMAIYFKKKIFI